jgi:acyl-CoA synthetase (AMP-forming)/AMP-acid ligase II
VAKVQAAFPNAQIWSFYGSAEASFIGYAALGSPYRAFPTVRVTIREAGEIWVESPMTITANQPMFTGDLGEWASKDSFHVLGRSGRQLVIKGEKYAVEPLEQALMSKFGVSRLALMCNQRGQVICIATRARGSAQDVATSEVDVDHGLSTSKCAFPELSCQQLNEVLRAVQPGFSGVRRIVLLDATDWPLTSAYKVDFLALQRLAEGDM